MVELLAAIVILAVIALLTTTAITSVIKDAKTDTYETQLEYIYQAAKDYGALIMNEIPSATNIKKQVVTYIPLSDIQNEGLLDKNMINSKTEKKFTDDDIIIRIISKYNEKYDKSTTTYEVIDNSTEKLPNEYQQVEYIESTGTQYIDTDYSLKSNAQRVYIDYEKTDVSASTVMFGSEYSPTKTNGSDRTFSLLFYGTYSSSLYIGSSRQVVFLPTNVDKRYKLDLVAENQFLSGVHIDVETNQKMSINYEYAIANGDLSTNNKSLFLFADNFVNDNAMYYSKVKIYNFKLYDDKELVRNLIPCYRTEDNIVGMYDVVEDKFYENSGTGEFIKGNDVE